jgi:hypothetical protein
VKDCRVSSVNDDCNADEIELGTATDASGTYYACAKLK